MLKFNWASSAINNYSSIINLKIHMDYYLEKMKHNVQNK